MRLETHVITNPHRLLISNDKSNAVSSEHKQLVRMQKTRLSQDCSPNVPGTSGERQVERADRQVRTGVQKQCYRKTVPSIVEGFGNDVSNVLFPKSKNIITCYYPASKGQVQCFLIKNEAGPWFQLQNDCPAAFLRQDGGRQVGRAGPAGRGVPGLPGTRARSGRGRPGWAWRARLGAIIQIGQIIGFLDRLLKILPGSKLLVKLGSREENLKLLDFWKTLHTVQ